ncbi:MAG: hypothetical protein ACN6OQ_09880, partial [Paraburkholderia nemoris]
MDLRDACGAITHRRGYTFGRSESNVTGAENARCAGLVFARMRRRRLPGENPLRSTRTPHSDNHAVFGDAPINRNTCSVGSTMHCPPRSISADS